MVLKPSLIFYGETNEKLRVLNISHMGQFLQDGNVGHYMSHFLM